jgi:CRP-like cAMP-binding protein
MSASRVRRRQAAARLVPGVCGSQALPAAPEPTRPTTGNRGGRDPQRRSVPPTARCHCSARNAAASCRGEWCEQHSTLRRSTRRHARAAPSRLSHRRRAWLPPPHFLHQNRLLRVLAPATVHQVLLSLHPLALRLKETLITRHEPITAVYFPLDAVVSVVSTLADGTTVEVGTIGNEGMVGLSRFLQVDRMPFTAVVQVPGAALKMEAEVFEQAVGAVGSDFYGVLARATQAWCTQLGQHAVCNRLHRVLARCARWLLQTQDRVGRAEFPLTQEFLAVMLGAGRSNVTAVASQLQQQGLIRYQRGIIHVLDRRGLEAASCECYGVIAQETERLLGPA